jgi:hypothetical protein
MPADNNFQDDNTISAVMPVAAMPGLKPFAVSMPVAQALMGGKARSEVYLCIKRGEVDAIKDGEKTLIVLSTIERRQTGLPRAVMSPRIQRTPQVKTGKRQAAGG